jgi:superfamily II DNA or RNA helicase
MLVQKETREVITTRLELRGYQVSAVDAIHSAFTRGEQRCHVEIPTGAGKSLIAAEVAHPYLEAGARVLVVAHRQELVHQLAQMFTEHTGHQAGVLMGSEREYGGRLTVASIQTLGRGPHLSTYLDAGVPALCVLDECHHARADSHYAKVLERLEGASVLGLSATPYRADHAPLVVGPVVFVRTMGELADAGWLCPLDWTRLAVGELRLDLVKIGQSEGDSDWQQIALGEEMRKPSVIDATILGSLEAIRNRQTLVFGVDVAHAQALAHRYRQAGTGAACVFGDMPRVERARVLDDWRAGQVQIITSCSLLTEGYDFPELAAIVVARPTMSPGLYVQMIGRGTRTAPGKADCHVVDIAGNPAYHEHRQIDFGRLSGLKVEDGAELSRAGRRGSILRLVDPVGRAPWAWGRTAGLGLVASLGDGINAYLIEDPAGAGLYRPAMLSKTTHAQWLGEQSLALRDAVAAVETQALVSGIRTYLARRDGQWRNGPASSKQLEWLRDRRQAITEGWTMGEVSVALTLQFEEGYLRQLRRRIASEVSP